MGDFMLANREQDGIGVFVSHGQTSGRDVACVGFGQEIIVDRVT